MADERRSTIEQKLSALILPTVLLILGYFAQQNYARITSQLDRIEQARNIDTVLLAELKLRILYLEQYNATTRPPQPAPPRIGAQYAVSDPPYVYSHN